MNIAVDAMGGDNAPKLVVQGAIQASDESGTDVLLVGDAEAISVELGGNPEREHIKVYHCEEAVLMDEPPLKAVRKKRDSSIRVAFDLLKNGKVDAVVSAGNSGATMAAGILTLGKLDGVERPAIACIIPGDKGRVVLIDIGGNVDCRPVHILQFGIMANAFATSCLGLKDPKVGLLSIGQEAGKGNEQVRLAYDLLKESSLNFIGNVEGQHIFSGYAQIVVCDGFVGNVVLKLSEGMAEAVTSRLKESMMSSLAGKALALFGRRFFKRFEETLDYAEYGGAPILGIKGVGIVCHGSSSARAIKNAINMAVNYVENRVQERLSLQIAELQI
ncbi:phosphate acyltransferase PlsX [Thermodesulfobacteriota bacterium]